MTNPEPAHKFTRANDFNAFVQLCNRQSAPPSSTGLVPQGAKRSFASRRMVQLAASFAAPEASFEARFAAPQDEVVELRIFFRPQLQPARSTNPSARVSLRALSRPKAAKTKRIFRLAKRNVSQRRS
jgi:hypothetical protein